MNRFRQEESYCESEFDIYQAYNSNSNSNNDLSASQQSSNPPPNNSEKLPQDKQRVNTDNQRRSKNISEVVVSQDNSGQNAHIEQLFKRPSKTMKASRPTNKKSVTKKEAWKYRKQIESCFIHK